MADWEGQPNNDLEPEVEEEEEEEDMLDMGEDTETNDREGLLMRFCPHDSSMLYPQVRRSAIGFRLGSALCVWLLNGVH